MCIDTSTPGINTDSRSFRYIHFVELLVVVLILLERSMHRPHLCRLRLLTVGNVAEVPSISKSVP